jgi:IS30 family transposase
MSNRTSVETAKAIKQIVESRYGRDIKSLTLDNGSENALHERVSKETGVPIYFADPYSSWQRGTNERHNGLLRQFFPKGTNFDEITQEELDEMTDYWNNRRRKILGYKTPLQVWTENTS